MHKCFSESEDKILCKKLYVKFGQNEDQMTRKTICSRGDVAIVVKNGKSKCEKLFNEGKKNEYELFLYKNAGYYYGFEKFNNLIPEMLSDYVEISSREYSLKGEKARYSRVMFSIRYLIPKKGEVDNGRRVYTQLPQSFSFSRIILFFSEKLNISSVDDFKKHADKIVVNFTYIGEDYSSHYSYF